MTLLFVQVQRRLRGGRPRGVSMTPRQTRVGRGARRRAVRLVRLLLRGRRLEPELALRADSRDPRAAHAADRRLSAPHRRPRVLARPLLHRQGARRVAAGAGAGAGGARSCRAPPASIRRRFPASPGRRTSRRSSRPASSPSSPRCACSGCRCAGAPSTGAALFAATRLRRRDAGLGLRDAVHGTRPDRRLPDDRVRRSRRARATARRAATAGLALDHRPRRRLGGRHRVSGGDPGDLHRPAGDRRSRRGREHGASSPCRSIVIVRIAAGVAIAAVPLLVYNTLAFGSPFHLGYASEEGFKELQTGFFGITYPRLSTIRELLVGSYRGLLPLSPLMAAAPVGLRAARAQGPAAAPRSWPPASAPTTCCSTRRTSTGKAAGRSARAR